VRGEGFGPKGVCERMLSAQAAATTIDTTQVHGFRVKQIEREGLKTYYNIYEYLVL